MNIHSEMIRMSALFKSAHQKLNFYFGEAMSLKKIIVAAAVLALTGLTGCDKDKEAAQAGAQAGAQRLPQVSVTQVQPEAVELISVLPGRITSALVSEVRPQVTGILQKRLFEEGANVKEGDVLYQIDPAVYEAAVNSAKAALANAESVLHQSTLTANRYANLIKTEAVSRQQYDDSQAAKVQAAAAVQSAKAALKSAEINLAYTQVKAPISGTIGRSLVTPGALVTANQASNMAVVQQLDPINVDFNQPSSEWLRLKKEIASGALKTEKGRIPIELILEDGSVYSHKGALQLSEVSVGEGTGTITIRAEFPNPDRLMLPGMFVRAKLPEGTRENTIRVPQKSVMFMPNGTAYVYVLNADNVIGQRPVVLDRSDAGLWVLRSGLKGGEKVVTEGFQRIRPGVKVSVVPPQDQQKAP
jgi:membrane fusion protein (multidrug efflux system)